jgi:hypothetical protein
MAYRFGVPNPMLGEADDNRGILCDMAQRVRSWGGLKSYHDCIATIEHAPVLRKQFKAGLRIAL